MQFSEWFEAIQGRNSTAQRKEGTINPIQILFSPEEQIGNVNEVETEIDFDRSMIDENVSEENQVKIDIANM